MKKNDFLNTLKSKISYLPSAEIEKSIDYYSEIIEDRMEDGMTEEEAVDGLGDIGKIVENIKLEMPMPALVKNRIKESHDKSTNKTLWIILAIIGSPIWVPLGLALVAVVLAVYVVIWALIISIYALLLALAVMGVGGLISGLIHCFITSPITGFMIIGLGIASIGLFIMSIKPIIWLSKKLIKSPVYIIRKIKSLFVSRNEVA